MKVPFRISSKVEFHCNQLSYFVLHGFMECLQMARKDLKIQQMPFFSKLTCSYYDIFSSILLIPSLLLRRQICNISDTDLFVFLFFPLFLLLSLGFCVFWLKNTMHYIDYSQTVLSGKGISDTWSSKRVESLLIILRHFVVVLLFPGWV